MDHYYITFLYFLVFYILLEMFILNFDTAAKKKKTQLSHKCIYKQYFCWIMKALVIQLDLLNASSVNPNAKLFDYTIIDGAIKFTWYYFTLTGIFYIYDYYVRQRDSIEHNELLCYLRKFPPCC